MGSPGYLVTLSACRRYPSLWCAAVVWIVLAGRPIMEVESCRRLVNV
jgi:hypothetical protein